jgi:hypothetical protein
MTFQTVLDTFFHPENQDSFARSLGWEDAEQMIYYEDMALQEEAQQHELQKMDSREVYSDEQSALDYWAGVY